ncbi:MAG: class II fructose-1,6-bisphosphate aldolase [Mycoplasma sp.]
MKNNKLVTLNDVLPKAKLLNHAVAQININNMEWIASVLEAANETSTPVILGVSEGAAKYMNGFKNVYGMVTNIMEFKNITVPVVLHLDHGSFDGCVAALEAGFSSVMYDGSSKPFDVNFEESFKILEIAKKYGASVEVEVGGVGGEEDGVTSDGEQADVEQCVDMVKLPISALAASVGSVHGIYPPSWKSLNFELLTEINSKTNNVPLVLHGGTGIPEDQIRKAISLGVAKVNVNTECQIAYAAATRSYIEAKSDLDEKSKGFDPRKLIKPGFLAIKKVCIEKFKLFGSIGTAV